MGNITKIRCDNCGASVARNKAVPQFKFRFGERRKFYLCISCAKHRKIPVLKARQEAKMGGPKRRGPRRV
ncbi:MAG: hypothetical protein GOU99_00635 [Candidatus Altiarchaeota archaeon]|nr:hypothetical protein [Candidatus Altiarchaeota archaeon]